MSEVWGASLLSFGIKKECYDHIALAVLFLDGCGNLLNVAN